MTNEERAELRCKFAAAALTGLLAPGYGRLPYQQAAVEAFAYADAMMVEAEKRLFD